MPTFEIYDRLKAEIEQSEFSNEQIISMLDVSRGTFYGIWTKHDMWLNDFIRLSEILNYSPVDLFTKIFNGDNMEVRSSNGNENEEIKYLREKIDQLILIITQLSLQRDKI